MAQATASGSSHQSRQVTPSGAVRCSNKGTPAEGEWWVNRETKADTKIPIGILVRGSWERLLPVLSPLATKPRISVKELVERVGAYCYRGGSTGEDPDGGKGSSERCRNPYVEIQELKRELRGGMNGAAGTKTISDWPTMCTAALPLRESATVATMLNWN